MKILGHIHTHNDEDVIDGALRALQQQTRPPDGILVVDNGSTDGTLDRAFPPQVAVIRHATNEGTNGSVHTGFSYALENGYDWTWILDADSVPRPDALAKLLELYGTLPLAEREKVFMLASLPIDVTTQTPLHGIVFSRRGCAQAKPDPSAPYYICHSPMWSGSLYNMKAVRAVGLPHKDWYLDWGDIEYGYRGMRRGLTTYVHQGSMLQQNLHTRRTAAGARRKDASTPLRCYYMVRNHVYFWLYEYAERNILAVTLVNLKLLRRMAGMVLAGDRRWAMVTACWAGLRDGLRKQLQRRYQA